VNIFHAEVTSMPSFS